MPQHCDNRRSRFDRLARLDEHVPEGRCFCFGHRLSFRFGLCLRKLRLSKRAFQHQLITHVLGNNGGCLKVNRLIDVGHDAIGHQGLDQIDRANPHRV